MITIIDYGLGNLASIKNMIRKVGGQSIITSNLNEISQAKKLILPGVGAFSKGMENLHNGGFVEMLNKKVLEDRIPILGICLGMQLLTNHSEEGGVKGLGWVDANTVGFDKSKIPADFKIPHMGWTDTTIEKNEKLFGQQIENLRYYFVHSYHVVCNNTDDIMCTAHYGYNFTCGIQKQNIMGVQFHPEKSHKYGMSVMANFISDF